MARPSMGSTHIEAEKLRESLATDAEATADLPDGSIETAGQRTISELPLVDMPKGRAFGFFAFAACALVALLAGTERPTKPSRQPAKIALAGSPHASEAKVPLIQSADISAHPRTAETLSEAGPAPGAGGGPKSSGAGAHLGIVTFESRSFVTSERSVAAVFIVRRTQAVRGGAIVTWAARSGSADAGIDFSDASGTVRFADGQRQRAIYVPLRNDLLKEEDETFRVCLRALEQARIGGGSCAEVTIRDDDGVSPT